MFVVLLQFSENRREAGEFIAAHDAWLQKGFDDGVFLLAGGLKHAGGAAILAAGLSHSDLVERVEADPFVVNDVVTADVIEISPGRADARLAFLMD